MTTQVEYHAQGSILTGGCSSFRLDTKLAFRTSLGMHACMCVFVYVCVCVYVCMHVCVYICV